MSDISRSHLISGPQCRAARALAQWSRQHVAALAGVDVELVAAFEINQVDPGPDAAVRLAKALEAGGAVFIAEDDAGGAGVRLKFPSRVVRAVRRWEGEGGTVGTDDV